MPTAININGKVITRPGVYALTKSGIKNPPLNFSYGNICIIDDGIGSSWGGGSGVNGSLKSGVDAVYEISTIQQFRDFVKGGELWNLAEPLFKPAGNGINGVSKVFLVKAATTTNAEISYTLINGSLRFIPLDEGENANGVLTLGNLTKGFACKIVQSLIDSSKFIFQFYVGTYKGIDPLNNTPYDGLSEENSLPSLFLQSPECSTVQQLIDWCLTSNDFKAAFKLAPGYTTTAPSAGVSATRTITITSIGVDGDTINVLEGTMSLSNAVIKTATETTVALLATKIANAINSNTSTGYTANAVGAVITITAPVNMGTIATDTAPNITGSITATHTAFSGGVYPGAILTPADVVANVGYNLASGATEVYNVASFDAAIQAVKEIDNTFFLATSYGVVDSIGLNNTKILDFVVNESKYEKFMVVAAGADKSQFIGTSNSSEATAKYYNTDKAIIVHGASKKTTKNGFKIVSQLYKAAAVLGRICGLEPQVPVTFKSIGIDGEVHKLSDAEKEFALATGILITYYDVELGYYVVQQGINSLQNNQYLVNEDGTSFDITIKRITAQLNKEIVINAKRVFFGKPSNGPNRNTVTEDDIKAWLEGFLQTKTASSLTDNLILRFGNITVTVQADNYFVSYEFVPNFPISKIVFTGVILEN